jgi:hypothetical protein
MCHSLENRLGILSPPYHIIPSDLPDTTEPVNGLHEHETDRLEKRDGTKATTCWCTESAAGPGAPTKFGQ